jgi:hypothetical protein
MNVAKDQTKLLRMSKQDDPFVAEPPQKCVGFMWELTAELWSLKGSRNAQRRLRRNVTALVKGPR